MEKFLNWFTGIFLIIYGSISLFFSTDILKMDATNFIGYIFLLIGFITLITGICLIILNIRRILKIKELKLSGLEITGEITDIKKMNFYVSRRRLYRLVVKDMNGNIYFSDGKFEWKLGKYRVGDKIKILISPDNPKTYFVLLDN